MDARMKLDGKPYYVLLAEDDPVSQAFLCEAIRACGGEPKVYSNGERALAGACNTRWSLLMLDYHLPGMNGDAVLAALRKAAIGTPALATTAEPDVNRAALLRAGFADVLPKPLPFDTLRAALARFGCQPSVLDDAGALRSCGTPAVVTHLRRLFAEQELPNIQHELDTHGNDHQSLRPTLHRLRAACGFCGATTLAYATASLHSALAAHADERRIAAALVAFTATLQETRNALRTKLDTPS